MERKTRTGRRHLYNRCSYLNKIMRISVILLLHILLSACNNVDNDKAITNGIYQKDNSSNNEDSKEQTFYNEFLIKISELSNIESPKFSILVYKNNKISQNLNIPDDMDEYLSFKRRFFTIEDVNFDGYKDFYFTDYMGIVNSSKIVYLYNPTDEKFEINEDYRSITSPHFDTNYQIIKSFNRGSTSHHESENYIFLNNKLTRVSKTVEDKQNNIYRYLIYDGDREVEINETLRKVKLYIAFFKTQKFNITIDLLENGKYRYVSWSASKNLRNNPDLILKNGLKKEIKNEISYEFQKGDFKYLCTINKFTNNGHLKVFQNQEEIIVEKATFFVIPNELKKYLSNQNKVTLEIRNS